jgi:type IV secretory pathway VirB4 component
MRLPPLTSTSAQLCSVYPFVADPGLPVDGPLVGLEVYSRSAFTFSLHELYRAKAITAPNMVVTGEIGTAKSSLLKCLAYRGIPFGVRFYGTDYKGEYDQLAALAGIEPVRIGPGLGVIMNPLAGIRRHPSQTEQQWLQLQRSRRLLLLEGLLEIQLSDALTEAERSLIEYAVDAVTGATDGTSPSRMATPTLTSVLAAMGDPARWQHRLDALRYPVEVFVTDSRRVRLALERLISGALGGVFDGPVSSNVRLDFDQPGAILDLRTIRASDQMTAMAMTCAQSWLETELSHPDAPPRVCFYDEFALIARHLPLIRRMREQMKLARALGIANVLAFHRFSDLAASGSADSEQVRIARGLIEDSGVRVSYRQATGSLEQAREFLGTTDVETDLLRFLRQGVGLWKIGTRSFVVKHQLSRTETPMVHTDSRMEFVEGVDDLTDADVADRLDTASTGTSS